MTDIDYFIIAVVLICLSSIYLAMKSKNRGKKEDKVAILKNNYPNAFSKYLKDQRISNLNNKDLNTILNIPLLLSKKWTRDRGKVRGM